MILCGAARCIESTCGDKGPAMGHCISDSSREGAANPHNYVPDEVVLHPAMRGKQNDVQIVLVRNSEHWETSRQGLMESIPCHHYSGRQNKSNKDDYRLLQAWNS